MEALAFRMTSLWFKLRDLLSPPSDVLNEAGIATGFHVLDYGCGLGSYSVAAAELVGQSGRVYAVDINPLALQRVRDVSSKRGLSNIETIHTDCATGLNDGSIDVVLLYDTYHDLTNADDVLEELRRILKPNSTLSFSDHHMSEEEILAKIASSGLFALSRRGAKTYSFLREG